MYLKIDIPPRKHAKMFLCDVYASVATRDIISEVIQGILNVVTVFTRFNASESFLPKDERKGLKKRNITPRTCKILI